MVFLLKYLDQFVIIMYAYVLFNGTTSLRRIEAGLWEKFPFSSASKYVCSVGYFCYFCEIVCTYKNSLIM